MENIGRNLLGENNRLLFPSTDKEKFCQVPYNIIDESIPYSHYKKVWTSNYGSLLISQDPEQEEEERYRSYQFSIWKPESSKVINLPLLDLKPKQTIGAATLLYPPGKPGSMVILFEDYGRYIIFYRFGDKQWKKRWLGKDIINIAHGHGDAEDKICQHFITHCNGTLYAATYHTGYLMMIEENRSNNLKLRALNCKLPNTFTPWQCFRGYLLDFCGQLCYVEVSWGGVCEQDIIDFNVLKLELSGNGLRCDRVKSGEEISGNGKSWVEVKSAEDRAFFLSDEYAFSCLINEPDIEGDHIYFFQHNRFYSINIKDKSFSASPPLQNLPELKNSTLLAMRDLIRLCNPTKPEHPISKLEIEKDGIIIEDNNEARASDLPLAILEIIAKKTLPG